jgi:hypothetical protein
MNLLNSVAAVGLALTGFASSAEAGLRWPSLSASEYCELRAAGVIHKDALVAAVREGIDPNFIDQKVNHQGKIVSRGAVKLIIEINNMCPGVFNRD